MNTNIIKVVVVGDAKVGKTSFVQKCVEKDFIQHYNPTLGVETSPLVLNTNKGNFIINIWDCAGESKYQGLGSKYWLNAQGAIIMFDVTNKESYENVKKWHENLQKEVPNIFTIVCGTKCDSQEVEVYQRDIDFTRAKKIPYYNISSKYDVNTIEPFVRILQSKFGEDLKLA